ncbi:SET and MYND domain-containing protein 4, partial [Pseudolycoriella hygida]
KRTSGEGSPFVNLLENVESVASITGVIDAGSKGNEKFVMRKFMDAMSLYNKSLCFAENDSENIALAYGNRSACFFHLKEYKKCLTDISLAMDQECPEHLLSKLVKRREKCEKEIASGNNIEEYRPEIRSGGNEAFPECSADLRIQNSESMGRCVVSCVDIPAGETVIIEEALFAHPDPSCVEDPLGLASDSYKSLMTREFIRELLFDTEKKQSFLVHLILQHVVITSTNSSEIGGEKFVFILSSYFNHSCEPNVSYANQHNRLICLTIRPIRAGEQLYVRYNDEVDGET